MTKKASRELGGKKSREVFNFNANLAKGGKKLAKQEEAGTE